MLHELRMDEVSARFRFVVPGQEGQLEHDSVVEAFDWLCTALALPTLARNEAQTTEVVISIADRILPFGEPAPDAIQFFEAYDIVDGTCVWRAF